MVIVEVGTDSARKTYILEKSTLELHSTFFARSLSMRNATNGAYAMFLPDANPEMFNIFRHFVRCGQIHSSQDDDFELAKGANANNGDREYTDREWGRLVGSWLLGEKLESCSFKDAVVDATIDKVLKDDCYAAYIQDDIYPKSTTKSAIRRLIVDVAIWNHDSGVMNRQGYREHLGRFYFDLGRAMHALKRQGLPDSAPYKSHDPCKYHEHDQEGKSCYKTMSWD